MTTPRDWDRFLPRGLVFIIKIDVAGSSEMSEEIYQTTRHHIPQKSDLHSQGHENLKSHTDGVSSAYNFYFKNSYAQPLSALNNCIAVSVFCSSASPLS
jgi:hypothetical protein